MPPLSFARLHGPGVLLVLLARSLKVFFLTVLLALRQSLSSPSVWLTHVFFQPKPPSHRCLDPFFFLSPFFSTRMTLARRSTSSRFWATFFPCSFPLRVDLQFLLALTPLSTLTLSSSEVFFPPSPSLHSTRRPPFSFSILDERPQLLFFPVRPVVFHRLYWNLLIGLQTPLPDDFSLPFFLFNLTSVPAVLQRGLDARAQDHSSVCLLSSPLL